MSDTMSSFVAFEGQTEIANEAAGPRTVTSSKDGCSSGGTHEAQAESVPESRSESKGKARMETARDAGKPEDASWDDFAVLDDEDEKEVEASADASLSHEVDIADDQSGPFSLSFPYLTPSSCQCQCRRFHLFRVPPEYRTHLASLSISPSDRNILMLWR